MIAYPYSNSIHTVRILRAVFLSLPLLPSPGSPCSSCEWIVSCVSPCIAVSYYLFRPSYIVGYTRVRPRFRAGSPVANGALIGCMIIVYQTMRTRGAGDGGSRGNRESQETETFCVVSVDTRKCPIRFGIADFLVCVSGNFLRCQCGHKKVSNPLRDRRLSCLRRRKPFGLSVWTQESVQSPPTRIADFPVCGGGSLSGCQCGHRKVSNPLPDRRLSCLRRRKAGMRTANKHK